MPLYTAEHFESELVFKSTRSSGKGGQNVNKVSSRIELYFDINASLVLSETQKTKIFTKLANRISKEGIFKIDEQTDRSQYFNKKLAIEKFVFLINEALKIKKKRVATKPSKGAKEERLKVKKQKSESKNRRRNNFLE